MDDCGWGWGVLEWFPGLGRIGGREVLMGGFR